MTITYTEKWNGFQFRSPTYLDKHFEPNIYDLVKWAKQEPIEVIDGETGEKKISTEYCYSVGYLIWNVKEQCFRFESVGMRYFEEHVEGLEKWIKDFADTMEQQLITKASS